MISSFHFAEVPIRGGALAKSGKLFAPHFTQLKTGYIDLTRFNKIAIQGTPQMAVD